MNTVTQYVPMLAFGFTMLVQTIALVIWITKSITTLQNALEHHAKAATLAALSARVDVLESRSAFQQSQIDNDKAGRAVFQTVSNDVAALKALVESIQTDLKELRVETRRG